MKSISVLSLIAASVLIVNAEAGAQVNTYKGQNAQAGAVTYYLPRTVLKVRVVAEKESIRRGPYARYAQKYLGVVAPLTDKDTYRIVGANIGYYEEADPAEAYIAENADKSPVKFFTQTPQGFVGTKVGGAPLRQAAFGAMPDGEFMFRENGLQPVASERIIVSYENRDSEYVKVPVDKRDVIQRSAEEMASDAANTIFSIRKRRFDLVSGEAGENVFGAGLPAALKELDRMEQEYLALFYGKRQVEQVVHCYDVVPDGNKSAAMICRFSPATGLLPVSDLSGTPVMVEFTPEKGVAGTSVPAAKTTKGAVTYRVADMVGCRLTDGTTEILNVRIPIYQFGKSVTVTVPSK